jgi:DNA-binding MarR family transcriptional regulator
VDSRLAYRSTDPLDRRRVLVHLATAGREVVERVCGSVERSASDAIGASRLPERAQLAELLEALASPGRGTDN